jgi:hypothetical protein
VRRREGLRDGAAVVLEQADEDENVEEVGREDMTGVAGIQADECVEQAEEGDAPWSIGRQGPCYKGKKGLGRQRSHSGSDSFTVEGSTPLPCSSRQS